MEKNGEYIGEVLSLGSEGEGVIKLDGCTAFVPFCLKGERVSFRALKVGGGVAYGKLSEVHSVSDDRVTPVCPHFEKCGGCQLQHAAYSAQLDFKRALVQNCLNKIAGISAEVNPTVASKRQYGYRNKLALPVGVDENGALAVGFYAPRSHRIVPVNSCALQAEWSGALIRTVTEFIKENNLRGYDEATGKGDVRHLVAREVDGKAVITVVATRAIDLSPFAAKLAAIFKKFTLWLNVNTSKGNAILGKEWHICRGEGYFYGEDGGIKFKAGANTFLQVNDDVRAKLYRAVLDAVKDKDAAAVDLYSGGGMLTAMLAKECRAAYGVEIVPEAVACADELKRLNGLDDKMFNFCGAVEERIGEVFTLTAGLKRTVVCDPPRKGMERSVVRAILKSGADKVVLVSCNPATLARDLGLLTGSLIEVDGQLVKNARYAGDGCAQSCAGDNMRGEKEDGDMREEKEDGRYRIISITPFDMFPQTKHVETLVVLGRA